jgi:hypothetical protein
MNPDFRKDQQQDHGVDFEMNRNHGLSLRGYDPSSGVVDVQFLSAVTESPNHRANRGFR